MVNRTIIEFNFQCVILPTNTADVARCDVLPLHDFPPFRVDIQIISRGGSNKKDRKGRGVLKWSLKALRVNAGLTAKEVADMIGIHQQTLLKYENDSSRIRADLLAQLANFYKVAQDDIFLGTNYELKRIFEQNQPN
ncbi:TPA: helix-turn-helix transcriptional regulator [Streptococcus suis]|nr:helix-turn-helix transcriptional regulator [Streptococcus suis]